MASDLGYALRMRTSPHFRQALALLSLLALLAGLAHAQVDDRARELLEGLEAQVGGVEITTLDQTMLMTVHAADEPLVSRTRTVIDYPGSRVASVTETMGMSTILRLEDGQVTMSMMGMSFPAPPGMDDALMSTFDSDPSAGSLLGPDTVATFDGEVDYGGVLAGQQVTYTGDFGAPGLGVEATTVRMVFDDDGRLLGQVVESEGMTMLLVIASEPVTEGALFFDMDMYEYSGGAATLYATMRYEEVLINQPIDETLFE